MRAISILTLAAMGLTTACASAADLGPNTIVASGYAEILTQPDIANIDIGVVTPASTAKAALSANSAEMSRVVAAIHAMGIADDQLQTSNFSLEAQHPTSKNGIEDRTQTTGYVATNKLTVSVTNLSAIGAIIDTAVSAGANSSNSVTFGVKNHATLDDQALADAVRNARHRAEAMTGPEHLTIGRMVSATDVQQPIYGNDQLETVVVTGSRIPDTPVLPGQVVISARVTAIFAINAQ